MGRTAPSVAGFKNLLECQLVAKAPVSASPSPQPGDFAGTYAAVGLGGAWVLGAGVVELKNDKGVTIALEGARAGIEFAANLSGINIQLECRHRSCTAASLHGPLAFAAAVSILKKSISRHMPIKTWIKAVRCFGPRPGT